MFLAVNRIKKIKLIPLLTLLGLGVLLLPQAALASPINASTLIDLTNRTRQEAGFAPLAPNHKLTQAAYRKARDLLNHGYFAHTTPTGKPFYQWIEEENYNYLYAGENLAIDFETNEGVLSAWLESASHRANIINPNYTEIGLVALRGAWQDHETTVVVQMFGSLLTNSPTVLGKIEAISRDLRLRQNDLGELATDLVLLPSAAGRKYFDVIAKPRETLALALSNPTADQIAANPITKVVQGGVYRTLLKSETTCCQNEYVFALTEEAGGTVVSTPIAYPTLGDLFATWQKNAPKLPTTPRELSLNIFLAGVIALLLLLSYQGELGSYLKHQERHA